MKFKGGENLYIAAQTVSKLLIQNYKGVKNTSKEALDLNKLETALNSNEMIKSAEVYLSVNGVLTAEVEQKKPIARVLAKTSYYIDDQGSYMPLSSYHSARVPLVTGKIDRNNLNNIYKIAQKVNTDVFLKKNVIQIHQTKNNDLFLQLRGYDFTVQLGGLNNLEKKINNLKAFYKKGLKDNILNDYKTVNLKFDSQVVCTKA
ncbi:cell division protein FtsQ/DivIB [Mangrovimonas spongiae]|uniref:cell division protein FtsQ/DivIB n=1 Tax=Mangrovimonas spongiae TaxID=2494697 RepID=UPI002937251E|nr:cell division protein FtsQ/DivIB [Mangrovimonas spongiae]